MSVLRGAFVLITRVSSFFQSVMSEWWKDEQEPSQELPVNQSIDEYDTESFAYEDEMSQMADLEEPVNAPAMVPYEVGKSVTASTVPEEHEEEEEEAAPHVTSPPRKSLRALTRRTSIAEILQNLNNDDHDLPEQLERRIRDFRFAQQKRREKYGTERPWGILVSPRKIFLSD